MLRVLGAEVGAFFPALAGEDLVAERGGGSLPFDVGWIGVELTLSGETLAEGISRIIVRQCALLPRSREPHSCTDGQQALSERYLDLPDSIDAVQGVEWQNP